MLRNAALITVLVSSFLGMNVSFAESDAELAKKFTAAQQLAAQGQITQAITAYQSLIHANPLLPEAYNNLAALYLKQKKTKKAKHILEQGLYAHKGYGVLYESLTAINVAMAREAYSKALQIELKPSNIEIASLSFNKNAQSHKKREIVISQVKAPVRTQIKVPVKTAKPAAIKRNPMVTKPKIIPVVQQKNSTEIERTLQAWSAAWGAQAVNMYLSFYHSQYKPLNGMSRKGWVQSRRYRLKKPNWIKVGLSNIKVVQKSGKQAIVSFKQLYQSNSFRDVSYKQMVLLYTDEGWRIFREKNI